MNKLLRLMAGLIILNLHVYSQEIVIVGWTFPGQSAIADTGITTNLTAEVITMGGTSDIEFKNGLETKAAQASGWNEGMDSKAWLIEITTLGYNNLTLSSVQQSGGNDPGPKDYKLQYSIEADVWVDIAGGTITVENDWTTSAVDNLPLPEACHDVELLKLRWVMASNEASGGSGTVLETGKDKIDNIFIRGDVINAIHEPTVPSLQIYPNPTSGVINISTESDIEAIQLISLDGQLVKKMKINQGFINIDLSELGKGIYFIQTRIKGVEALQIDRIIVQ
jgi:hypothetical protein